MIERRNFNRFNVKKGAFVEVKINGSKIGEIIDISEGGLAFSYIDIGTRPEESFDVDLYFQEKGFRLQNLPAKTISDISIKSLFALTKTRRQGVQFGELNESQTAGLKSYIENFATGLAQ
jgi:hypothetical protein